MLNANLIRLLSDAGKYIAGSVLSRWISLLSLVAAVFIGAGLIGETYDQLTSDGEIVMSGGRIGRAAALLLLILLIRAVCGRLQAASAVRAGEKAVTDIREALYEKLFRMGITFREQTDPALIRKLAGDGTEQLEHCYSKYLPQFLFGLAAPVTLFFVLMRVCLPAASVLLICTILYLLVLALLWIVLKRRRRRPARPVPAFADRFREMLAGMDTLKMYQADAVFEERMQRESDARRKSSGRGLLPQLFTSAVLDILACGGAVTGMIVALHQFQIGNETLTDTLKVLFLAFEFFLPLRMFGAVCSDMVNGLETGEQIFAFLEKEEPETGRIGLHFFEPDIKLANVRYSHDGLREDLRGLDLHLEGSGLYSLVGEAGSGKSTAASLIAGRLRGAEGMVRLSGLNIETIREADIMKHVLYVHRDSYIFDGSVAENLLIANPYISRQEMAEVLQQVELMEFLNTLDGVDTLLHNNASELTDGQRQRLILARAILYNPAVLIIDGLTSDIDMESEAVIMRNAERLSRDKIVLLVSRRLKNVIASKTVYLMEKGRVAESGSHRELMARKGKYYNYYRRQTGIEQFARSVDEEIPESFLVNRYFPTEENREQAVQDRNGEIAQPEDGEAADAGTGIKGMLPFRLLSMSPLPGVFLLLSAAAAAAGGLAPFFICMQAGQGVLMHLAADEVLLSHIFVSMGVLAVLFGLFRSAGLFGRYLASFRLSAQLRRRVTGALRALWPDQWPEEPDPAKTLPEDIERIESFYVRILFPLVSSAAAAVVILVAIGRFCLPAGFVLFCIYLAAGAALLSGKIPGIGQPDQNRTNDRNISRFMQDSIQGLEETIQFGYGIKRRQAFAELAKETGKTARQYEVSAHLRETISEVFRFLAWVAVLFITLQMYRSGSIELAGVLLCTLGASAFFGPLRLLNIPAADLKSVRESGIRIRGLLQKEKTVRGQQDSPAEEEFLPDTSYSGEPEYSPYTPAVQFEHVFAFSNEDADLYDISAVFGKNEITGIYGPSGSGKSVMLKLITRQKNADKGIVRIDGRNINQISEVELRSGQAMITKDTWLFRGTIYENIEVGKSGADQESIIRAAQLAFAHDEILALKDGYRTEAGEAEQMIPAGLRQRIGLARAILSGASMILLDEPTANLDAYNEGLFLHSLLEQQPGKTLIIASRRRSAVDIANRIYHIENTSERD